MWKNVEAKHYLRGQILGQANFWSSAKNLFGANFEARPGQWDQARFYSTPIACQVCTSKNFLWMSQITSKRFKNSNALKVNFLITYNAPMKGLHTTAVGYSVMNKTC